MFEPVYEFPADSRTIGVGMCEENLRGEQDLVDKNERSYPVLRININDHFYPIVHLFNPNQDYDNGEGLEMPNNQNSETHTLYIMYTCSGLGSNQKFWLIPKLKLK